MDETILKQLKTTCPFPLLIYKTSVKYNEVRKASGIAYIILDLIQKESKSNDKISDVLLKFGIPANLHYIFGQEIANLMSTDILSSHFDPSYFAKPTYFKQITIGDVELTPKGKKMFQDGAIPTGAEKVKVKDIYYSPVTRKFDVESKVPYMTLGSSFLGDDFMDHINVDISGMEDYINANRTKIGLKAEERVVSFECEEPQKMHTRKEEGMTIIIRPSGVEFKFDTTDENAFFNKYYTSRLMTDGLLAKNKYKFVNEKKDIVEVPTVSINELTNITNVYIPDDAQKQASRPCKFFFSKNRLGVKGVDTSMKLGVDDSTTLLSEKYNYPFCTSRELKHFYEKMVTAIKSCLENGRINYDNYYEQNRTEFNFYAIEYVVKLVYLICDEIAVDKTNCLRNKLYKFVRLKDEIEKNGKPSLNNFWIDAKNYNILNDDFETIDGGKTWIQRKDCEYLK